MPRTTPPRLPDEPPLVQALEIPAGRACDRLRGPKGSRHPCDRPAAWVTSWVVPDQKSPTGWARRYRNTCNECAALFARRHAVPLPEGLAAAPTGLEL